VDLEAIACVHSLQYNTIRVQYSKISDLALTKVDVGRSAI